MSELKLDKPPIRFLGSPYGGSFGCWEDLVGYFTLFKNRGAKRLFLAHGPESVIYAKRLPILSERMLITPSVVLLHRNGRFLFHTGIIGAGCWDPTHLDAVGVLETFESFRSRDWLMAKAVMMAEPFFREWLDNLKETCDD